MAKRYIDADELIGQMHFIQFADGADRSLVYALIDMQPTADAVEVVRCRDCEHLSDVRIATEWNRICRLQGVGKSDNGFCDEGERKYAKDGD